MATPLYPRKLTEYKRLLTNTSVAIRQSTLPANIQFTLHAYFEEQLPIEAIAKQMNKIGFYRPQLRHLRLVPLTGTFGKDSQREDSNLSEIPIKPFFNCFI